MAYSIVVETLKVMLQNGEIDEKKLREMHNNRVITSDELKYITRKDD